jgi:hypothetical protein
MDPIHIIVRVGVSEHHPRSCCHNYFYTLLLMIMTVFIKRDSTHILQESEKNRSDIILDFSR